MSLTREELLGVADRIGAALCRDAFWAGDCCNWMGDVMEFADNRWQVVHKTCGADLYGGTAGIALFLSQLHAHVGEPIFRETALAALQHAMRERDGLHTGSLAGVYSGDLGIAYAARMIGWALGEQQPHEEAEMLVEELHERGPLADGLDVVMGSAGAIPALLALHARDPDERLMDLADRHARQLLKTAHRGDDGWSWDTLQGASQRHLTGFAHGTAGIAWAFLELFAAAGNEAYADAAREAIRYEQTCYSDEHRNWPDFRDHTSSGHPAGVPVYATAWCHGAPGIGLSRVRAFEILGDDEYRDQALAAVATTTDAIRAMTRAPGADFTFCHGIAGNLELALLADAAFGLPAERAMVEDVARWGWESYGATRKPWPPGVTGGEETAGLMLGTAAAGTLFLRLVDPAVTPSVVMIGPRGY